jgi:hypothetical protein
MIINSHHFSNDEHRKVSGQYGSATFRGSLRITTDEPEAEVKWGPKVRVPAKIPFRIVHPAFRNTTYILEDIRYYGFKRQTTFLERSLQNIRQ